MASTNGTIPNPLLRSSFPTGLSQTVSFDVPDTVSAPRPTGSRFDAPRRIFLSLTPDSPIPLSGRITGAAQPSATASGSDISRPSQIGRTLYRKAGSVHHVGVDHGGGDIRMPQQLLHGADVIMSFEKVGGKRVARGMATDLFGDTRPRSPLFHGFLDQVLVDMVKLDLPASGIDRPVF